MPNATVIPLCSWMKTANFSCFDNDTNIVKWMVAKIIHRHSISHMLQRAFKMCVIAVLILFQQGSMYLFQCFTQKQHFLSPFNFKLSILTISWLWKNTQKTTPYWMWTILNWIVSLDTWQNFFLTDSIIQYKYSSIL